MADKIMRSPILLFDSNPVGRVLTRFSKELVILDSMLGMMMHIITISFARTIGVIISVIAVNYLIIIPVALAVCYITHILKKGKKTMIDAQRLDSMVRGPIHTTFGMIVSGLVTLRQYEKLDFFEIDFINNL